MISYEFGDIVLVPFPFTDQSARKKRPAVVVSSTAYHSEHSNLILMGISSLDHLSSFRIFRPVELGAGGGLTSAASTVRLLA